MNGERYHGAKIAIQAFDERVDCSAPKHNLWPQTWQNEAK
jgi:hypothetical protein